jgi:hypothetical protein
MLHPNPKTREFQKLSISPGGGQKEKAFSLSDVSSEFISVKPGNIGADRAISITYSSVSQRTAV